MQRDMQDIINAFVYTADFGLAVFKSQTETQQ